MPAPVSGSLLAAVAMVALAGCTTGSAAGTSAGRMIADGQPFRMKPGEQVMLGDRGALRYVRVVNDSRCPPGVQCIWAGDAEVAFEWTATNTPGQAFSLHTGKEPKEQALGDRRLVLLSLERGDAPAADLRVDPSPGR
jgi:hypothetical protein